MAGLDNMFVKMWVGDDDVVAFCNKGNKAIFDDVFDDLGALRNGPVLKGHAAQAWDTKTLHHEQYNVVQPLYTGQSHAVIRELSLMAAGNHSYFFGVPLHLRFNGNLLNPAHRVNYGAKNVTEYYRAMKLNHMNLY